MRSADHIRRYWSTTWPPRFLFVILLCLAVRLLDRLLLGGEFNFSEFANLPVAAVVGLALLAFFTSPVAPPPSDGGDGKAAAGPTGRTPHANQKRSPWIVGLLVLLILLVLRFVLHFVGWIDLGSSDFLPVAMLIVLLATLLWSVRIR